MKMDFQSLNSLNVFVNSSSGNLLPVTNGKMKLPAPLKIYAIVVWTLEFVYITVCILGLFYVPKEKALADGTVNIVVNLEVLLQLVYLHNRKNLIRGLIGKLNGVLAEDNEMLRNTAILAVKSMERTLKFYVIGSVSTVVIWTALPLMEIFRKNEFYYADYGMPAALSREPFSVGVFAGGIVLELFGGLFTIFRKVSLDIYTIHFILLMTVQYRYLRTKFVTILRSRNGSLKSSSNGEFWEHLFCGNGGALRKEMRVLTRHHRVVVE